MLRQTPNLTDTAGRSIKQPRAYLWKILKNTIVDGLRRQNTKLVELPTTNFFPDPTPGPETRILAQEELVELYHQAQTILTPNQLQLLNFYIDTFSQIGRPASLKEIANHLDTSVNVAKSRLSRIRKKLKANRENL